MNLDVPNLRRVIEHLRAQWQEHAMSVETWHQPASRKGKPFDGMDVARVSVVKGLARRVDDNAAAVLLLTEHGHVNAAIPLVRQVYECALTSVWIMQSKDHHGIKAFLDKHSKDRIKIREDARAAANPVFRDGAEGIADTDRAMYAGSFDELRSLRELCLDLSPGGIDAYIYYRLLSAYSHASLVVTDGYFEPVDGDEPYGPTDRVPGDDDLGLESVLYFAAISMLWSARAFVHATHNRAHRSVLQAAARELEVDDVIQLSQRYLARHLEKRRRSRGAS